jgi:hypothetical protein
MAHSGQPQEGDTTELIQRMSAGATDVVEAVIPFRNDDVPKYLENLRRFQQESRQVEIMVE